MKMPNLASLWSKTTWAQEIIRTIWLHKIYLNEHSLVYYFGLWIHQMIFISKNEYIIEYHLNHNSRTGSPHSPTWGMNSPSATDRTQKWVKPKDYNLCTLEPHGTNIVPSCRNSGRYIDWTCLNFLGVLPKPDKLCSGHNPQRQLCFRYVPGRDCTLNILQGLGRCSRGWGGRAEESSVLPQVPT